MKPPIDWSAVETLIVISGPLSDGKEQATRAAVTAVPNGMAPVSVN
jgi:hypothetical protein